MKDALPFGVRAPRPVPLAAVSSRLMRDGLLLEQPKHDIQLHGASDDSREITEGDLFCAWRGAVLDAHAFVPAAAEAGAVAALVERHVPDAAVPQIVVRDGRRAAAIGAAMVYGDPQSTLRIAGVTGTNGKTTSVWILRHLLGARYRTASLGTLGVILEDGTPLPGSEALTTPGPVQLARTLRYLVDRDVEALAMEVSSHALEQGRVQALGFDVAVFTNLSRDHLDYHGTLEAYHAAKLLFATLLREGGTAVANADDPAWSSLDPGARRLLRFGIDAVADVRAEAIELGPFGARFECVLGGRRVPVAVPLLGRFNVQNALAAAAAGHALGFEPQEIAGRLSSVPQVPGRLERIAERPCPVLRDYAHTPDALARVLAALRPLTEDRLIVVFGAGGDRDRGKRPLMGAAAASGADVVIVTSDNPRTEEPERIIDDIVADLAPDTYVRIADRREAIAHALGVARAGDIVLLAGKGHETYQVLGTERHPFDEREVVAEVLGGRVGGGA